jgi:hypothetical protein
VWADLALGGLLLLTGLGRLVIDVTVEPLVEKILRLPGEQPETRLLRRMTELVEAARASDASRSETARRPVSGELLERLAIAVEESRRAWLDTVADLSAAADALRATMGGSAEAMQASLHSVLARLSAAAPSDADARGFAEFQAAVERLTTAIEHLGMSSNAPMNEAASIEAAPRRGAPANRVAAELAKLLREINAKP